MQVYAKEKHSTKKNDGSTGICLHCSGEQKGDYMKKNFGKQVRRRCMSVMLASALVICTPAADTFSAAGIIPKIVQKAKAADDQVNDDQKLNSDIIADAALLAYLREQTGKGEDATVKDLRSANLKEIVVPADVHDLKGLKYARNMTSLDLSQCKAVEIGEEGFDGCASLQEVKLPDSINRIGKNAFNGCTSLESINLSNIDYFGDSAFGTCGALTNDSIASMKTTVKEMGSAVFSGCKSITEAKVPVITGEYAHMVPAQMFNDCEKLENVIFCDDKITGILDQAFAATGALTFGSDKSNKLPDTVESVGQGAFSASKIPSIDLKSTKMTWISKSTFLKSLIEEVILPDKLTDIREGAFESSHIKEIVMPNTVEKLGISAFRHTGNLMDVKLSVNITEIPEYAFQNAGANTFTGDISDVKNWNDLIANMEGMKVTFNGEAADSKLETIGNSAFNASTICNEDFLAGLTKLDSIGKSAFSYTDFKKVTIPACVTTLDESAFAGMYMMKEVVFAKGSQVTELPKELFGSSKAATNKITYADLVLQSVQLPDGLESIGEDCFGNCWALETIGYTNKMVKGELHFPETLTTIEKNAFESTGFYEITAYDDDGVGYAAKYCVPVYPAGYSTVYIPDSVTSIGEGAFQNSRMLKEIYFGDGLTELPANVCAGCGSYPYKENTTNKISEKDCLVTPTPLPSGETGDLGETTYDPIKFIGLKSVKLPKNVEVIGNNAFKDCYALEGFYDEASKTVNGEFTGKLVEIGSSAFMSCKSLGSITIPTSLETIGDSAFAQTSQDISQSVTSLSTGKTVSYYKQYTGLRSVDFLAAQNLKSIGKNAFQRSNLTTINFKSNKLEELAEGICEDCYNLGTVVIPDSVKKINQNAFRNTYKLSSVTGPLSAEWSDKLFSGVAGYAKSTVTILANKATEEKNIYYQQENAVDFNCVKNFKDMTITVTDEEKSKDDKTSDLLNHDSNEFVKVKKEETETGQFQAISMYGKAMGDAKVRVSGTIRLEGDIHAENNTTSLNDACLVLQVSQLYNVHVTGNPIDVLQFSSDKLAQEAGDPVLYLEYGSKNPVNLKASYIAEDSSQNTTDSVEWSMDNTEVASIDGTPLPAETMTPDGKKQGESKVNILPNSLGDTKAVVKSSSGKTGECKIRVRIAMDRISVSRRNVGIDVGKEFSLSVDENNYSKDNAALLEENPGYQDVYRFSSSDEKVATVDAVTGTVKTVGEGTAVIKVTSLVSGKSDSCTVKVQEGYIPPADSVQLSETDLKLFVGDDAVKLTAEVFPEESVQKVEWSSSDESVATVSDGTVKPLKAGKADITAKAENGKSAVCHVVVNTHVDTVSMDEKEMTMYTGQVVTLKAQVLPEDATDKNLSWSSSDEAIVKVDASGRVTAVAPGTASITAETVDGKSASCKITVQVPAESVKLSQEQLAINVGEQAALTASVLPEDASQSVEWTSSDASVATVAGGVVTAVKEGSVSITVKTANGKTAVCKVQVKVPVQSVTLDKTELFLEAGASATLKAEIAPKEATEKKVTWTSGDESIATVNSSGTVKAVKAGTVTITATADGKSAACTVKVGAVVESVVLSATEQKVAMGGTVTLTASVTPAEANQAIEWKSSDETVATVVNGVVTGLKIGTCNITAKAAGSNKETVCKLTVTAPKVKLISAKNVKKKAVKVKWKKIDGVAGYQVAVGKKKKMAANNSLKIKKLKKKKKYAVKVRAYTVVDGKNVYGQWSKVKKVKIKK